MIPYLVLEQPDGLPGELLAILYNVINLKAEDIYSEMD